MSAHSVSVQNCQRETFKYFYSLHRNFFFPIFQISSCFVCRFVYRLCLVFLRLLQYEGAMSQRLNDIDNKNCESILCMFIDNPLLH